MPSQEGMIGKAALEGDKPEAVATLVHYLYHLDYEVPGDAKSPLSFHVMISQIARKYSIKHLQSISIAKFTTLANKEVHSAAFAFAVQDAYGEGDAPNQPMRNASFEVLTKHPDALKRPRLGELATPLASVLISSPTLAEDLAFAFAEDKTKERGKFSREKRFFHNCHRDATLSFKMSVPIRAYSSQEKRACP